MGKTILTANQHFVLELATKEQGITDWFYFTGGTALSEFYLHHRYSEDLDFFSEDRIHEQIVDTFVNKITKDLNATSVKRKIMGHIITTLTFSDRSLLKLDFVYQPYRQLEYGIKYNNLRVASLWDIAVDKLYTIFNRLVARDFVDLYFAIKEVGCDLDQLIKALEEKYEMEFHLSSLLARFPAVRDVTDYPKMLAPFDKKEMEDFFLKEVKKMEGKIFK
jgi:predicted nucleotidyltransferase component of viral defense system